MPERCALIAIIGRPNVGKSTLLNCILGQKISITSRKPQTTRYQIMGVHTVNETQLIFVDTPGWQRQPKSELNRLMNRQVRRALADVDCIVMMVDARGWRREDELVFGLAVEQRLPRLLALNKHDLLAGKSELLPRLEKISRECAFDTYVPICARTGDGVDALLTSIMAHVPERPHLFPADQVTDRPLRFLAGEVVREKLMRYLGDELPYATSVAIEEFDESGDITRIHATVWVERESQKAIVIGKAGRLLKQISSAARRDLEALLEHPAYLRIWVKTKSGWANDRSALGRLGMCD